MLRETCPGCGKRRRWATDYVCSHCFSRLPGPTRNLLYKRDGQRLTRYAELLRKITAGTRLEEITVG